MTVDDIKVGDFLVLRSPERKLINPRIINVIEITDMIRGNTDWIVVYHSFPLSKTHISIILRLNISDFLEFYRLLTDKEEKLFKLMRIM